MFYTAVMGMDIGTRDGASGVGNRPVARKHTRFYCNLAVRFEGNIGSSHTATTVNVSEAGLFVKTPVAPTKEMLMLEVSLTSAKTVYLWSEVRHLETASTGSQAGFGVAVPAPPTVWREFCDGLSHN